MSELANKSKFPEETYSNAAPGPATEPTKSSPDYVAAGTATVNLLAALQANKAARDAAMANTGCKEPGMFALQKKKTAYKRCLAEAQIRADKKQADADALARDLAGKSSGGGSGSSPSGSGQSKPFFKTGGGIAVIVGGSIVLIGGIILLVIKLKK